MLLVAGMFLASRLSPNFLDIRYLLDSSTVYVEAGLLALAMTLVIISGNIDLSVGSMLVLTACLSAKMFENGWNLYAVTVGALAIGTALGLLNGMLVAKMRLPSFLVTLGTMAVYRGSAQAILGSTSVKLPRFATGIDQAGVISIPWPTLIFAVLAVGFGLLLHRTVFGRYVIALGTNEKAALFSALPIDRLKMCVFALSGLMAGVGAMLLNSRLGVARHDTAMGLELEVITIAIVGGTSIYGGKGSILGTTFALMLVMLLKTAMGVANIKAEYQLLAIGGLLVLAVFVGQFRRSPR